MKWKGVVHHTVHILIPFHNQEKCKEKRLYCAKSGILTSKPSAYDLIQQETTNQVRLRKMRNKDGCADRWLKFATDAENKNIDIK